MMLDPRYGLQDAPTVDLSCILPAGGFLSTPSDLVRFGSAMMGDALLDPATVEELQTPVRLASGESTGQALGWIVRRIPMGADGAPTRIVGQGLGDACPAETPLGHERRRASSRRDRVAHDRSRAPHRHRGGDQRVWRRERFVALDPTRRRLYPPSPSALIDRGHLPSADGPSRRWSRCATTRVTHGALRRTRIAG